MTEILTPIEQIIDVRTQKLKKLELAGVNPFPAISPQSTSIKIILDKFLSLEIGASSPDKFSVNGRIISMRDMGKACFININDATGKIQLYIKKDQLEGDSFVLFKETVDIGDFINVSGLPFRTRTGELTLQVFSWQFLSKAIRPLPEKWHGLKDVETRYRQRYLDLIANPDVKDVFVKRSVIISTFRNVLEQKGFLEVETPIMQSIPGGAAARPFKTFHNALSIELFMRIAPELYLKRLVVGGLEKVYEIGRNFRNEGIDRTHNPEFTMLELYQAYADYNTMMDICETLISSAAKVVGFEIKTPFKRVRLFDLLQEYTGRDVRAAFESGKLKELAIELKLDVAPDASDKKIIDAIFDQRALNKLIEPIFVLDYPSVHSPLAKPKTSDPVIAERFELYINGQEIANAYSELNNPIIQRERFLEQVSNKAKGDEEAQPYDDDYIIALEHGLPPTGGLGIGIDRLVMFLTNTESIREVILFPLLRP